MAKLTKTIKAVFKPKDIMDISGRDYQLSFNDDTKEQEIWCDDTIIGIYDNGFPKNHQEELLELIEREPEYKELKYYANELNKTVRYIFEPVHLKHNRVGIGCTLWIDL